MEKSEKKLLIIDDEENMRHMLTTLLKKSGYRVDNASNGYDGFKMVKEKYYSFILCDLKMPEMGRNGIFKTGL